ncbi:MAG: hypothetical protein ACYCU3_11430 [Streptosporangiaceae bacterium]
MRILMAGAGSDRSAKENFDRTVRHQVDLTLYRDLLTADDRRKLDSARAWSTRIWGINPSKPGSRVADLRNGDQAWIHHDGYVWHIARITAVLHNRALDEALWPGSTYPTTGFVFALTPLADVQISKTEINALLGFKPRHVWQNNRRLAEDESRLLADLAADAGRH